MPRFRSGPARRSRVKHDTRLRGRTPAFKLRVRSLPSPPIAFLSSLALFRVRAVRARQQRHHHLGHRDVPHVRRVGS